MKDFVWKGPKKWNEDRTFTQEEIKLSDATDAQLQSFYNQCNTMLYNEDTKNPGRMVVLDETVQQVDKCNAELFIRYMSEEAENKVSRQELLFTIRQVLDANKETLSDKDKLKYILSNVPEKFALIPTVDVLDACLYKLGIYNNKHITLRFLCRTGLWFTKDEIKAFNLKELTTNKDRLAAIHEQFNLPDEVKLHISSSGLSYTEFKTACGITTKRYNELTKSQLTLLRDKILPLFYDECHTHIEQWDSIKREIEQEAKRRNIE
jgi:hypothetical protein